MHLIHRYLQQQITKTNFKISESNETKLYFDF